MAESKIKNQTCVRYGSNQEDNGVLIIQVSGTPTDGTLSIDLSGYGKNFKTIAIACPSSTGSVYVTGATVTNNMLKIRSNATAYTIFNVLLSYVIWLRLDMFSWFDIQPHAESWMATSTIKNPNNATLITLVSELVLPADRVKATGQLANYNSITLNVPGFYILAAEAEVTNGSSFNGRIQSKFEGNGVSVIALFTFSVTNGFGFYNSVQFACVSTTPLTVNYNYWTSNQTGSKHTWRVYRVAFG